jgi:hypothetical protein
MRRIRRPRPGSLPSTDQRARDKEKAAAMAETLREILLTPDNEPKVIADTRTLIDQELSDKSGVSAAALKLAYKTVTSFAPGYFHDTLRDLLPQVADSLQPFWADFNAAGGSEFGDYLSKRGEEVSEALLSVTDTMRGNSRRPAIVKAYNTVRGSARKHIEAALPRLGDLVMKYAS